MKTDHLKIISLFLFYLRFLNFTEWTIGVDFIQKLPLWEDFWPSEWDGVQRFFNGIVEVLTLTLMSSPYWQRTIAWLLYVYRKHSWKKQASLQLKTTLCITIRKEFVAKATRGLLLDSYGGHWHGKNIKCVTCIYICVNCL